MPVRLIASDLDGTLFAADHRPAPRTVAAVNAARDAGIYVVAITGRSHFGGAELATSTGARLQWFIGSNGGHRLNFANGVIEERLVFTTEVVAALTDELPPSLGDIGFGWELEHGMTWDRRFVEISPSSLDGRTRAAATGPPEDLSSVGKIFIGHEEVIGVELVELIEPHLPAEVSVTTSGAPFVEVTPDGADKGSGLSRLCEELGVAAEEVVAFGDNHNDISMLEWAGRGLAMANASPEVQAVADEVAPANTDFGVARTIEAILSP